jgi:hypothetical protein
MLTLTVLVPYFVSLPSSVRDLALALALCKSPPPDITKRTGASACCSAKATLFAAEPSCFQMLVPPQQRVQQIICGHLLLLQRLARTQPQLLYALSLSNLETGKLAEEPGR